MMNRQASIPKRCCIAPGWGILLVLSLIFQAGCTLSSQEVTPTPIKTVVPSSTSSPTRTPIPTPTHPSPTPTTNCLSLAGRREEGSLPADGIFKHKIDYRLYIPPCYEQWIGYRFPVLYLFHGLYYADDQWDRIGALEIADQLIASGEILPFLIVMPFDPTYREPSEYGFDEAILEVLIPYIDANYRTHPDRQYRAVGGLSRGGGWAIHFAFTRPDLFGTIGGHSPIVLYDDGESLSNWLDAISTGQMPRIYLDIGDKDSESMSVTWFEGLLTGKNIPHEFHVYPGRHTEEYWMAHVEEYIRWYAAGWGP